MNKFDDFYNYRLATISDVDNIMGFLKREWNENHILASDRELFLWQYGRTEYGDYENINFVLMTDKEDNILGGIGVIAYSEDLENLHISTAITKIKKEGLLPMSGVELMKRQNQLIGEKVNFASGANPDTILPIFEKVFHHKTGVMQQYYMLNPNIEKFAIAYVKNKQIEIPERTGYALQKITNIEEVEGQFDFDRLYEHMSVKSKEFLQKRYFEHPIYIYEKWLVRDANEQATALLFGRVVTANQSKALRIVDYRGDIEEIYKLGGAIQELIEENGYEYADLMVDHLDCEKMKTSGFELLDVDGENIIPNYFEPFVQKNIRNHFQKNGDVVIFKADGDQDRPNRR